MKTTEIELRVQGWEFATHLPEKNETIFIKFEGLNKGFKVGVLKNGDFKHVDYKSVQHYFEEDRSPI